MPGASDAPRAKSVYVIELYLDGGMYSFSTRDVVIPKQTPLTPESAGAGWGGDGAGSSGAGS